MTGIKLLAGFSLSALALPIVPVLAQVSEVRETAEWLGVAGAQVVLAVVCIALAAALVWMALHREHDHKERVASERERSEKQEALIREVTAALLATAESNRGIKGEIARFHDAIIRHEQAAKR